MRITATVQDDLIKELLALTHAHTKTGAINAAIQEWVAHKKRQKLIELRGKVDIQDYSKEQTKLESEKIKKRYGPR